MRYYGRTTIQGNIDYSDIISHNDTLSSLLLHLNLWWLACRLWLYVCSYISMTCLSVSLITPMIFRLWDKLSHLFPHFPHFCISICCIRRNLCITYTLHQIIVTILQTFYIIRCDLTSNDTTLIDYNRSGAPDYTTVSHTTTYFGFILHCKKVWIEI